MMLIVALAVCVQKHIPPADIETCALPVNHGVRLVRRPPVVVESACKVTPFVRDAPISAPTRRRHPRARSFTWQSGSKLMPENHDPKRVSAPRLQPPEARGTSSIPISGGNDTDAHIKGSDANSDAADD